MTPACDTAKPEPARSCGNCRHFLYEDADGYGYCSYAPGQWVFCARCCERHEYRKLLKITKN